MTARRFLSIKDPQLAAEQLVASWFGTSLLRQSLGMAGPLLAAAIAERVRYAVDTLVRAWSKGAEAASADKTRWKRV
jgi:TetR/AcrR family transcriptional repressor of mexJK operon